MKDQSNDPSHHDERPYHGATSCSGTRNRSMGPPRRIDPTTNRTSTHGKCFRLPGFTANDCKNGFLLVRLHFYQVSLVVHIDISENKNNMIKKYIYFLHTRVGDSRCVSKWYTTYVGDRFSEVMTQ